MAKQVIIEGNIGCGKSSLLGALSKVPDTEVFYEPLEVWDNIKDAKGRSLLDVFYEDPERYSYLFQSIVFKTRLKYLDVPQVAGVRYIERSVLTDYYVFMMTLFEMGKITDMEKVCYEEWYFWLKERCFVMPDAIIYIRSTPEICHHRIMHRNRSAESKITLDYLRTIHEKHEVWLSRWTECKVFVVENPLGKSIDALADEVTKILKTL
jgi:deoxyadenosine/deoxycytidine kinase